MYRPDPVVATANGLLTSDMSNRKMIKTLVPNRSLRDIFSGAWWGRSEISYRLMSLDEAVMFGAVLPGRTNDQSKAILRRAEVRFMVKLVVAGH